MFKREGLEKAALYGIILFAATLTNALFFNQLGYYFALICLTIIYFKYDKNICQKTGLEIAFVVFVTVELVSLIYNGNFVGGFEYFLKKLLLMPTAYVLMAGIKDFKDAKIIFYTFVVFALGSEVMYLYYAFDHYSRNMYTFTNDGPSVLQHTITTVQMFAVTSIILLSFFLVSKTLRSKIIYAILLVISVIAMFATYKRTGWLGFIAGALTVLIVGRYYKTIAFAAILLVVVIFTQKNYSGLSIYELNENLELQETVETLGYAYSTLPIAGKLFVAEFSNGVSEFENNSFKEVYKSPAPVKEIKRFNDSLFVALHTSTLMTLQKVTGKGAEKLIDFVSPGLTIFFTAYKDILYAVDADSGLSVFTNLPNSDIISSKVKLEEGRSVHINDSIILCGLEDFRFSIFRNNSGLPGEILSTSEVNDKNLRFAFFDGYIPYFYNQSDSLTYFNPLTGEKGAVKLPYQSGEINRIFKEGDRIIASLTDGRLYIWNLDSLKNINTIAEVKLDYVPFSISISENKLYLTEMKRSRILSIVDPDSETNQTRFAMWKIGFRIAAANPIFGTGEIDLREDFIKYRDPLDKETHSHLHNTIVQIAAWLGILGLLSYFFILYALYRLHFKALVAVKKDEFSYAFVLGAIGAISSFIVSGFTEYNFSDHEIIVFVWFTTGMTLALAKINKSENSI